MPVLRARCPGRRLFQIAHVAACAAQAQQAALLRQIVEHLVQRLARVACMTTGIANGSKSPTRLLCGKPDLRTHAHLVATLLPSRIAHSELDPPRWHEMIRKSVATQQARPFAWRCSDGSRREIPTA